MDQTCPKCRLISPVGATRCDCGWDFAAGQLSAGASELQTRTTAATAKASWLCPLIAWGSQIVLALTLRGVPGLGLLWLIAMLAQGVLIVLGLYFGAKVLALGRSSVPPATWGAALMGVVLSGGTILLIVGLSVAQGL
jgi:hypothetical protein